MLYPDLPNKYSYTKKFIKKFKPVQRGVQRVTNTVTPEIYILEITFVRGFSNYYPEIPTHTSRYKFNIISLKIHVDLWLRLGTTQRTSFCILIFN